MFESHGFKVKLIPAQHAKPFVKGNKNNKHDALAIAEANRRPNIHFVPIKSIEQQGIQCLHRVRQRLISYRTGLTNQIRGLLTDYGIIFTKGHYAILTSLPLLIEDMSIFRNVSWKLMRRLGCDGCINVRLARFGLLFDD